MRASLDNSDLDPRTLADLSALADGSLDPARRADVEATIAASPELTALYERERRVVELVREANATIAAPAALRARIEASRPSRRVRTRRRVVYGGSLAGALAAAVLAVVIAVPGGGPGAPSVGQAAQLAMLGSSAAAPAPDASDPGRLAATIQGVQFPNWGERLHWHAVGQRIDNINGRVAVTVYYAGKGKQVAYTIVGAPVLKAPAAEVKREHGVEYRRLMLGGRTVITWNRAGHTCVVSATGVPVDALERLAAWRPGDAVA